MTKISRAVGAIVALCSLNALPVKAQDIGSVDCSVAKQDEQLMAQLVKNIEPDFSIRFSDLCDHAFFKG